MFLVTTFKKIYLRSIIIAAHPKMNRYEYEPRSHDMKMKKDAANGLDEEEGGSPQKCNIPAICGKTSFLIQEPEEPFDGKQQQQKTQRNVSHVVSESPPKRRRFQRRNSATSNMLSMAALPLQDIDLPLKEDGSPSCPECDKGIDIAEDFVQHFQTNRQRHD